MKHLLIATLTTSALLMSVQAQAQYTGQPSYGYGYSPSQNTQRYVPNNNRFNSQRYAPQRAYRQQHNYAPQRPSVDFKGLPDPAINVKYTVDAFRKFIAQARQTGIDPTTAVDIIADEIADDIDFTTMTQMALGRLARRMSPQKRAEALNMLKNNFTSKLVELAGDNINTQFQVGNTRIGTSQGELMVPLMLKRGTGQPITVNLRFYKAGDKWKVFDAEASGQSVVMFYRNYFARQFRPNYGPG
ncbi:MAG: ABC transporter substrate-binding protein [Magnetovibrio sp.]|nr:ABC transporter substrate-binding protein [Magnetovibrio sp.]